MYKRAFQWAVLHPDLQQEAESVSGSARHESFRRHWTPVVTLKTRWKEREQSIVRGESEVQLL